MTADRAVSVTLSYVLMLAIATVVLASVLFVSADVIDGEVDRALEEELTATGESLAADIQTAEQLVNASGDVNATTMTLESRLPDKVSGVRYEVTIDGNAQELTLSTTQPEAEVVVPFRAALVTDDEHTVPGGRVEIVLTDADELEVRES